MKDNIFYWRGTKPSDYSGNRMGFWFAFTSTLGRISISIILYQPHLIHRFIFCHCPSVYISYMLKSGTMQRLYITEPLAHTSGFWGSGYHLKQNMLTKDGANTSKEPLERPVWKNLPLSDLLYDHHLLPSRPSFHHFCSDHEWFFLPICK